MITEEMLTVAALELSDTMNKYMPSPEDCVHTFSPRFHRKMRKVIRKAEHPVLYQFARKAAAIVLIVFLGFMTLLAVSPSVRADVVGWIKEKYETFYEYYFVHDNFELGQEAIYGVDPIPEGYKLIYHKHDINHGRIILENNEKSLIRISYYKNLEAIILYNEIENLTLISTILENGIADIYKPNINEGDTCIVTFIKEENIALQISGQQDESVLMKIIKNFKKIN